MRELRDIFFPPVAFDFGIILVVLSILMNFLSRHRSRCRVVWFSFRVSNLFCSSSLPFPLNDMKEKQTNARHCHQSYLNQSYLPPFPIPISVPVIPIKQTFILFGIKLSLEQSFASTGAKQTTARYFSWCFFRRCCCLFHFRCS